MWGLGGQRGRTSFRPIVPTLTSTVVSEGNAVVVRSIFDAPDPFVPLGNRAQLVSFPGAKESLPIGSPNEHVLAVPEVVDRAGVKAQLLILLVLDSGKLVEGERLIPAPHRQKVERLVLPGGPRKAPDRGLSRYRNFLITLAIADGDLAGEHSEGQELSVVRP